MKYEVLSANESVARTAYKFIDVACVYPITPSTEMAEKIDKMSFAGDKNFFDQKVMVKEMQSESGSIGMMHGALTSGALASTFTCSQGLLLMIPEMYRISAAFLPGVIHVASRSVAKHALSIMGDHSDVYSCRQTGWAMICSSCVQETYDFAAISHLSAIHDGYPFLHFFDGFRTSHEIQRVRILDDSRLFELLDLDSLNKFRNSSLNPYRNFIRGCNQGDDIYFQCCEAGNIILDNVANTVKNYMNKFNKKFGTNYHPFDFYGHPEAEYIIISMGSICGTVEEVVDYLMSIGKKVGLLKVRMFRPFIPSYFDTVFPKSVKKISVLDKSKEPGSIGEPLFLDVLATIDHLNLKVEILRGRYGIAGKNTTPNDILQIFDNMFDENSKKVFTVGINDDITNLSLKSTNSVNFDSDDVISCKFFGYGSDGMVGAVKNISGLIGKYTDFNLQYYPQYDSKKSGGLTISHLRFSKKNIKSEYYIDKADYLICSKPDYLFKYNFAKSLKRNSILLINSFENFQIPEDLFNFISQNNIKIFIVDANKIASEVGLKTFCGIIMQGAFLKICEKLQFTNSKDLIKDSIKYFYEKKNPNLLAANLSAIDKSFDQVKEINVSDLKIIKDYNYIENANNWPVSKVMKFANGDTPCGTSKFNSLATLQTPEWIPTNCSQCGFCSMVCPHACIRIYSLNKSDLKGKNLQYMGMFGEKNSLFLVGISSKHCTGCSLCCKICPGIKGEKALKMSKNKKNSLDLIENSIPNIPSKSSIFVNTIKGTQLKKPLLQFSPACPGCGETPYAKLVTQLFGERLVISNATGCSSIWGGSFGDVPYITSQSGFTPAWQNSLFEDAAEFGLGMLYAHKAMRNQILSKVQDLLTQDLDQNFKKICLDYISTFNVGNKNFDVSLKLISYMERHKNLDAIREILSKKEYLSKKSFWIFGGDGWAYDIGFGGLDHVLASGENINVLVFDTEIYSNTGGQASKATQKHASASFELGGKSQKKKNLAKMFMQYENVYVSQVAMGANLNQCLKAFIEAEKYEGPSLIIAYSPCIGHGIKGGMSDALESQALAVKSGYFKLFRYNSEDRKVNNDSVSDSKFMNDFFSHEKRFRDSI